MGSAPRMELVVAGDERGDVQSTNFSGEFGARFWRDNPACVNELIGRIEQFESVEKERTLFRIEQREAFVEKHLANVGFNLREIRIDGAVECEVLADSPA